MTAIPKLNAQAQPFTPTKATQAFDGQKLLDTPEAQQSPPDEKLEQLQYEFLQLKVEPKTPVEQERLRKAFEPAGRKEAEHSLTTSTDNVIQPPTSGPSRNAAPGTGVCLHSEFPHLSSLQQCQQYSPGIPSRGRDQRTSDQPSQANSKKATKPKGKGAQKQCRTGSQTSASPDEPFKTLPSDIATVLGIKSEELESNDAVDIAAAGLDDKRAPRNHGISERIPMTTARKLSSMVPKLPVPTPSAQYIAEAHIAPRRVQAPQRLLIIIDLNGTVLFRPSRNTPTYFIRRPKVEGFFEYLLANHEVMVWSSARPANVERMCDRLFAPEQRKQLVAIWGRDTLGLSSEQYSNKVQVYKRLHQIWQKPELAKVKGIEWNQSNTLLIDDSLEKAMGEPYNAIQIPEFRGNLSKKVESKDVLLQVERYLEEVKWWDNVSSFVRKHKFVADE